MAALRQLTEYRLSDPPGARRLVETAALVRRTSTKVASAITSPRPGPPNRDRRPPAVRHQRSAARPPAATCPPGADAPSAPQSATESFSQRPEALSHFARFLRLLCN